MRVDMSSIPTLDSSNYELWSQKVKLALQWGKVFGVVDGSVKQPVEEEEKRKWTRKDKRARLLLEAVVEKDHHLVETCLAVTAPCTCLAVAALCTCRAVSEQPKSAESAAAVASKAESRTAQSNAISFDALEAALAEKKRELAKSKRELVKANKKNAKIDRVVATLRRELADARRVKTARVVTVHDGELATEAGKSKATRPPIVREYGDSKQQRADVAESDGDDVEKLKSQVVAASGEEDTMSVAESDKIDKASDRDDVVEDRDAGQVIEEKASHCSEAVGVEAAGGCKKKKRKKTARQIDSKAIPPEGVA